MAVFTRFYTLETIKNRNSQEKKYKKKLIMCFSRKTNLADVQNRILPILM